jgi:hypothetical protein
MLDSTKTFQPYFSWEKYLKLGEKIMGQTDEKNVQSLWQLYTWVEVSYLWISWGENFPVLSLKFLFSFSLMKLNCGMNQREGKEREWRLGPGYGCWEQSRTSGEGSYRPPPPTHPQGSFSVYVFQTRFLVLSDDSRHLCLQPPFSILHKKYTDNLTLAQSTQ